MEIKQRAQTETMKVPDNINRSDVVVAIHEWILGEHAERNRNIMIRRLIDGWTYEKIAEEFEMSDRQIKNIVYKCQDKVFRHIRR